MVSVLSMGNQGGRERESVWIFIFFVFYFEKYRTIYTVLYNRRTKSEISEREKGARSQALRYVLSKFVRR